LASFRDQTPRGVIWVTNEDGHYNALCQACDDFLLAQDNE
jgi:hypothetical protein